jgi:anti-anti-sigma factor
MLLSDFESKYFQHYQTGDNEKITVVRLLMSHMTDEDNIEVFGLDLTALIEQYNCDRVIVDAEKIEYVTSSVLGKLITLHRKLHRTDGRMVICHVGEAFGEVLQTSRLHNYFTIVGTVEEAVQQFSA